jgi:3-isopropylmalate/(R)-2-methylmalate dehydratase small subunit
MEPFRKHSGVVAPMDRVNVDTDQIIPKQFLKRIERTGFGQFLFYDWRFDKSGEPRPEFVLNRPEYAGASIIAAGRNFGSGSSREHAPWALMDYGFRCVVAPSLADIFQKNCFENGLVPILLPEETIEQIIARAGDGGGYRLTVDLEECHVTDSLGLDVPFVVHNNPETHAFRRYCLLNGLDDIGLVLDHEDKISAFERRQGARARA